ncbi:MAG: hypothetical protein P8188_02205 [Gemmatimonadota bacterium]
MITTPHLGRLTGVGALAALLFTAACDSPESTGPSGLMPPEVGLDVSENVDGGIIWVCQETSPETVGEYSFIVGGDGRTFPVQGENTQSGTFQITGGFDGGVWGGVPGDPDGTPGCAQLPVSEMPAGTFQVKLLTPATFGHESGFINPNRWTLGEGRFGNFLFETSYRDDLDCDEDGQIGEGEECPLRLSTPEGGAIVWFKFEPDDVPPPPGLEGCTPGGWRNNDGTKGPNDWWESTPYTTSTLFSDVFGETAGLPADLTLKDALFYNSNEGGLALVKHATAAVLNASSDAVDYPYTEAEVVEMFQAAWADLEADDNETKDMFDAANNLGCSQ